MNFINQYCSRGDHGQFSISAQQASGFAKQVAGDFNPIHHIDSKRFCVPGDLLFGIALSQYGLHKNMAFKFLDLVKADTPLRYPAAADADGEQKFEVVNDKDKPVLGIAFSAGSTHGPRRIEQVLRKYVAFSGQNFPHILVPLMKQHNAMINPQRPLVIYESMSFQFDELEFEALELELQKTNMTVDGKRGNAELHFTFNSNGRVIGSGLKNLVLSGLREYDEAAIQWMCDQYLASKGG